MRDPLEATIPNLGIAAFQDAETGEVVLFDTASYRARRKIVNEVQQQRQEQRRLFNQLKMDYVELSTEQDYLRPLVMFFRHRAARMR